MQADLLFKQEEKEKSEATAKTLDLGKNVFVWNIFIVYVCAVMHVCMKEFAFCVSRKCQTADGLG